MALRLAHLTDIHLQPERGAPEGFAQILRMAQEESPDFLLMGGDLVMDSLGCTRERLEEQWDLYCGLVAEHVRTPMLNCLGNHDVWGWNDWERYRHEDHAGKRYAQSRLGLRDPYYSLDAGGWHLVVLDSTHSVDGNGYTARLDDAQFAWLTSDLEATAPEVPVAIFSHIPIFAACPFLHGENERTGEWQVPGAWMHLDVRRIQALFRRFPNVKACFSGHMHLSDRVDYQGVSYFCNPAVCASWWNGPFHEFGHSYTVISLTDEGDVTNHVIDCSGSLK